MHSFGDQTDQAKFDLTNETTTLLFGNGSGHAIFKFFFLWNITRNAGLAKFGTARRPSGECDKQRQRPVHCVQRHQAATEEVVCVSYSQRRSPDVDRTRRPALCIARLGVRHRRAGPIGVS